MVRNRVLQKINGKKRVEDEEVIKELDGCPCPGLKGCLIDQPVMPGEESVTLICSATPCPFSGVPIHKVCFETWEDQLLRTLGGKGSARGWTEYKARRNLWRNSGQGLIVMHCRCLCKKGTVHPPEEVVLAERILVAPLDGDKKKKTKKKDLPSVNMNGGNNPKQARMQARLAREEMIEDERNLGREFFSSPLTTRRTRNNSVTSFSSQSIISTSSNNRTAFSSSFAPEEDSILWGGGGRHSRRRGKRRDESRTRLDSGVSVKTPIASPVRENKSPMIPATTPPPLTKSFAATIANPLCKGDTLLPETWYTRNSVAWEIVSRSHYDPWILRSHDKHSSIYQPPYLALHNTNFPEWNPWNGKDFKIGEKFSILGIELR